MLQTRPVYEQQTHTHLAEKLQEAAAEWKLEKPIAVTIDNARNIVNAVNNEVSVAESVIEIMKPLIRTFNNTEHQNNTISFDDLTIQNIDHGINETKL